MANRNNKRKKKRKRRGRPTAQERPLSAKEVAQRQTAPVKHGLYAQDSMVRAAGACSKKHCPLGKGFPCDARRLADERGEGMRWCVLNAVSDDDGKTLDLVRLAFETGDLATLQRDLTGPLVALQFRLSRHELERLMAQGSLAREQPIFKDGKQVGAVRIEDPAVAPLLRMLKNLGVSMEAQGATPMSKAQHDFEVSAAGLLTAWGEGPLPAAEESPA